jgi:uncharacterized protein YjdB
LKTKQYLFILLKRLTARVVMPIITGATGKMEKGPKDRRKTGVTSSLLFPIVALALTAASILSCGRSNPLTSITVAPSNPVIVKETSIQLLVTAVFSDGMTVPVWTLVNWSSSNPAVAEVSSNGLVTTHTEGEAVITAVDIGHPELTSSAAITVTKTPLLSIAITPSNPIVVAGATQPLTATGIFADGSQLDLTLSVLWGSSYPNIASVSNAPGSKGFVSAVAEGTTLMKATETTSNLSGITTVTVVNP